MRKCNLTLNAKNINFTNVLPGNCGSHLANSAAINRNEDNLIGNYHWRR